MPYAIVTVPRRGRLALMALLLVLSAALPLTLPQRATADEFSAVLERLNTYRAWLGLPPMTRNPALDAAASGHARYYQMNYGDPSLAGMGLHAQQPGRPGFTGADMLDRARAAGYGGWVNENIGMSGSMMTSVDWFIDTINHRLTLIDPRYTEIGFGAVNEGGARLEVIDVGAPAWSETASTEWIAWPPDGTTGVGLSFGGEAPNPFPGASYPTGYPITLKYFGAGAVTFDRATLTANGQEVPSFASAGNGWLTKRTFMIAASAPLTPATDYTVSVEGRVDGASFTRSWNFSTRGDSAEPLAHAAARVALAPSAAVAAAPPSLDGADPAVRALWQSYDGAVASLDEARTWLWGPDAFAARDEPYAESPNGKRQVFYFDKSRMEITDPGADRSSRWFVTNGLLVRDLILGAVQVGDNRFDLARPATVPLAGDPGADNPDAPTYASLRGLATLQGDNHAPDRTGQPVAETLAKSGAVGNEPSLAGQTTLAAYDEVTGHNVAAVFHDWMLAQPWDPVYVVGRPIAEPYWVQARVDGTQRWVLVQAFERRVLTYTPGNPDGWQVEMGNVGRHYYEWRYGEPPPGS